MPSSALSGSAPDVATSSALGTPASISPVSAPVAPADLAIRVQGISKSYTIAHTTKDRTTIAEALLRRLRQPLKPKNSRETFWALRDATFDIAHGEVVGIIGRNGAGKSTLLKILSRITAPTAGRAELYGRVGSLLEVGTGFHRELTGRENIYLNGAVLGMRRGEIDRHFDAIVDFAGVEKFLDTPVKHYSSGMYVRLAFAVAAHLDPEILIIDEVLAVGDVEFQRKCLGKMKDVAQGGRTILFVSHNMRSVASLCTRAILMRDGSVAADGKPEDVITEYSRLSEAGGADGDGAAAQVRLPIDTTKDVQFLSVTVRNARGEPALRHDVLDPVTLDFEFEVRREMPSLIVSTTLRSPQDEIIFITTEADWPNHQGRAHQRLFPKSPGKYAARVTLPAPLLNNGKYEVVANLFKPGEIVASHRGIRFEITDVLSFASCLEYSPRRGHLAVPVPWEVGRE
jgi:lipopolysaccharide transport system ATP-binding protein